VEGNHRIDADTVRSYFHPAADGRFDAASLDAALKALIATGLFEHVEIGHNGERLIVHLTEAKVLDRVVFEGNKKIKDKGTRGRRAVQNRAAPCSVPWYRPTSTASWKPTAMPGRRCRVVPEIIDRGNDRVDLVYEVTEGSKTTVRQINFVGNQVFSKRQLAVVIKNPQPTC